ncbi:hypothetical protein [Lentzea albida]|uniref:Uncharacterized protein n=1 Tax=Lentzea albida TaxID=65499 RepID=A0A1H9WI43_9PSEU|nr:hypothetical protein [Lentzea albida]SES33596.1 hypothetical protein SAMN04488000_122132 [Lentzea albida]
MRATVLTGDVDVSTFSGVSELRASWWLLVRLSAIAASSGWVRSSWTAPGPS